MPSRGGSARHEGPQRAGPGRRPAAREQLHLLHAARRRTGRQGGRQRDADRAEGLASGIRQKLEQFGGDHGLPIEYALDALEGGVLPGRTGMLRRRVLRRVLAAGVGLGGNGRDDHARETAPRERNPYAHPGPGL